MERREKAEAMRSAILDAAQAAFAKNGFTATRLRDITAPLGVTQPLIHHYYGTKELLFEAVMRRAFSEYDAQQKAQWGRAPDDVRFFTEGLRVLFAFVGQQRTLRRLVRWAQLEGRLPELPDSDEIDTKIFTKFVEAHRAGVLRADIDIDVALLIIDGTVVGFWERVENYPDRFPDLERLQAGLIDSLLQAILSDDALARARMHLAEPRDS